MRERRGKGKQRNMNGRLMGMGNGRGIDCGDTGDGVGEINGEKGKIRVTEEQLTFFKKPHFSLGCIFILNLCYLCILDTQMHIRYMICKYFFPFYSLSFIF